MIKTKQFFIGLYAGMKEFSNNIIIITNSALLIISYLIGVGPTSLVAKLYGKHFLDMELSEKKSTYWSDLNLKKKPIEEYYRQF
jgi:hypothetical protein